VITSGTVCTKTSWDSVQRRIARIKASAAGRVGTPDEIGATAAFLMARDGSFITGTDLLIDGGVIAAIAAGRY
jgi:NAD(P)-dependent dehydrogenase (short-subunit alcohol dehydrogenase family)